MKVRTVLGDVAPDELGVTDSHDHLFFRSALLPGQELDDPAAAEQEVRAFAEVGGQTIVQWTPHGLGRGSAWLAKLSVDTGVHLIAATGLHRAEHYSPDFVDRVRPRLAETFVRELSEGLEEPPTGQTKGISEDSAGQTEETSGVSAGQTGETSAVRAGLIKVAGGFHVLDGHARQVLSAAAEAHHATGAPIAIHHELGTAADAVLGLLVDARGVPPTSVILGHLNRFPDHDLHLELAARGAFLAFDGPSRANHATDPRMFDCLAALADAGYADRLLLGGDTTTARARSTAEGPGIPYLLTGIRPRLIRRFGEEFATSVFITNPARAFATVWRT